jgi:anti-sigma factor RsiW
VRNYRVRWPTRSGDHDFSQRHLSHYVEGDLSARARRRLERHAAECPDCSQGIRAMKALLRLIARIDRPHELQAPASVFDRVRADAIASPAEPQRGPER